jgi:hypothetical protein
MNLSCHGKKLFVPSAAYESCFLKGTGSLAAASFSPSVTVAELERLCRLRKKQW